MASSVEIVQSVEDDVEAFEPGQAELGVFDIRMVGFDLDMGVELPRRGFGDLRDGSWDQPGAGDSRDGLLWTESYQSLGLLDVFLSEEELTIQIAQINRVKIHDVDLAETGEDQVLEKLAANATGAD